MIISRLPSSGLGAVSSVKRAYTIHGIQRIFVAAPQFNARFYATPTNEKAVAPKERPERAALLAVQSKTPQDRINAPRSTLPPVLRLPERGPENVALYYFRVGKTYGGFYITGVKAVWFNYKAAKMIRERVKKAQETADKKKASAMGIEFMSRAEFQILQRNDHDIGKLPLFSVLVALLGEWLPLVVPFMPGVVPGTCRIPKQITDMRGKAEQRRRTAFRSAIQPPTSDQLKQAMTGPAYEASRLNNDEFPTCYQPYTSQLLSQLRAEQLFHLSSSLNIHNRMWDWLNLPPPAVLLRRALSKRLANLSSDDVLLLRDGGVAKLTTDELNIACEQRGIDVNGRREELLRENLHLWLKNQREDRGVGFALFKMLFGRPNVWSNRSG